jgi:hypothetical protein
MDALVGEAGAAAICRFSSACGSAPVVLLGGNLWECRCVCGDNAAASRMWTLRFAPTTSMRLSKHASRRAKAETWGLHILRQ